MYNLEFSDSELSLLFNSVLSAMTLSNLLGLVEPCAGYEELFSRLFDLLHERNILSD